VIDWNSYTHGPFRYEERDGWLHFRGTAVVAIADLSPGWSEYAWQAPAATVRAGLIAAGVNNPFVSPFSTSHPIYRCRACGAWGVDSDTTYFCSGDCGRAYRAQQARERRAKARGPITEVCTSCGGPLNVLRVTRTTCSDRCRSAEYRKRHRLPPAPARAAKRLRWRWWPGPAAPR